MNIRLSPVVIITVVVFLVGCVASPGGSNVASAPASGRLPATSPSEPTPDPSATAVPQKAYGEAEFWDRFGGVEMQTSFASLDEIVAESDVVVVATVADVSAGRQIPVPETGETEYMVTMTLSVDEEIKGTVLSPAGSKDRLNVEALLSFSPPGSLLDAMIASAPIGRQVLLFLGNRSADVARHGLPADHPAAADDLYFMLTGTEGYVLNVDGKAGISKAADAQWLDALSSEPFDHVLAAARAAVRP